MTKSEEELERLIQVEKELRETLEGIGPTNALYASLMAELDTIRAQLSTIKKLFKL